MSKPQNSGFFDRNTLLAMAIVFGFWWVWQKYLAAKYPDAYKPKTAVTEQKQPIDANMNSVENGSAANNKKNNEDVTKDSVATAAVAPTKIEKEETVKIENEEWSMDLSNRGLGFSQITLKKYTDREKNSIVFKGISADNHLYETRLNGKPIYFSIVENSAKLVKGVAVVNGIEIEKIIHLQPEQYSFNTEINVKRPQGSSAQITTLLADTIKQTSQATSWLSKLFPHYEVQDFYAKFDDNHERVVMAADSASQHQYKNVSLAALSSHYFSMAMLDQSQLAPNVEFDVNQSHMAKASINYDFSEQTPVQKIEYLAYAGPKSLTILKAASPELGEIINFGFFSSIARVLLFLLKTFHSWVGNWGWAIIILTLVVRALLLPINVRAYRSMKKMQAIQPQLKAMREKYSKDPQTMNRETMALMKQNGVNPIGGCLPTLLQLPVFFALYQVLGQSVELYQAPFIFWIHDLSFKDPYYVLPILMGISMFVQQKITPTTMDPTQAKILLFMPVMFSFLMFGLPSGLTLYIFVSTAFGIFQQMLTMKDYHTNPGMQKVQA